MLIYSYKICVINSFLSLRLLPQAPPAFLSALTVTTTKHCQHESIHVVFSGQSSHDQEPLVQTFRMCDEGTPKVRFADCRTCGVDESADPRVSGQADSQGGVQGEEVCLHVQGDDSGKDRRPGFWSNVQDSRNPSPAEPAVSFLAGTADQ